MSYKDLESSLNKIKDPYELFHLRTKPRKCRSLVYNSGVASFDTVAEHFFVLSHGGIQSFALECMLYESENKQTLFISKADTTGYSSEGSKVSLSRFVVRLLQLIIRLYGDPSKIFRICLFARAERQYLYPFSEKNPNKHVLGHADLVKWWLRILDQVSDVFETTIKATLQIPGSDISAVKSFFPTNSKANWAVGDIFWNDEEKVSNRCQGAVYHIPRFPDDPKSRFLDFLVYEKRSKRTGQKQFWLELQARQEFRLGIVVGIIGMEARLNNRANTAVKSRESIDTNVISYKKFKILKDLITTSDYSTVEHTKKTTELLSRFTPSFMKIQLTGALENKDRNINEQTPSKQERPINMLSAGLIRKKSKPKS